MRWLLLLLVFNCAACQADRCTELKPQAEIAVQLERIVPEQVTALHVSVTINDRTVSLPPFTRPDPTFVFEFQELDAAPRQLTIHAAAEGATSRLGVGVAGPMRFDANGCNRFSVTIKPSEELLDNGSFEALPTRTNLVVNPSFEQGMEGWTSHARGRLTLVTASHTGTAAMRVTNRSTQNDGPSQDVASRLQNGMTYTATAWVKLDEACTVHLRMVYQDGNGDNYITFIHRPVKANEWDSVTGEKELSWHGILQAAKIFFTIAEWNPDLMMPEYTVDDLSLIDSKTPPPTPGWEAVGCTLTSTTNARDDSYALRITGRNDKNDGPRQEITSKVENGATYVVSSWIKPDAPAASTHFKIYYRDETGDHWQDAASVSRLELSAWTLISGRTTLRWTGELEIAQVYFEVNLSDGTATSYILDAVSLARIE